MRPRYALLPSLLWGELRNRLLPDSQSGIHHESADSEEDRKGLVCQLGQGLNTHMIQSLGTQGRSQSGHRLSSSSEGEMLLQST